MPARPASARPSAEVREEQALFFRARRSHLTGPGAADVESAAAAILGAQAQQENPALLALSLRTASRPTATEVRARLLDEPRRLVRTWGQRDTLHLYAVEDWPRVISALPEWHRSGRQGAMPTEADLSRARRAFEAAGRPLLRRDLFAVIPSRYVAEIARHPGVVSSPERLAASRLIWLLAREGSVCFAHRDGTEQAYAHRAVWLPEVDRSPRDPAEAATVMVRRYLASFAPATAADVAHFFGARAGSVRAWLERLGPELADVECGDRRGLLALAADLPALAGEPPRAAREWPLRLLPQWDLQTMTHKDRSWVVPRPADAKRVWRKAGVNAATVIDRGRFVATWSYRTTSRRLCVTIEPLSGWRLSHRSQVEREVAAIAAHLELPEHEVAVEA